LIKIVIPAVFKRESRVFLFSPVSQKTLDARLKHSGMTVLNFHPPLWANGSWRFHFN